MTEPYPPYAPPPYYDRHDWRHAYRREPPFLGFFVRFAIGIIVLLILIGVLRAVWQGGDGTGAPWPEVAGGLGIAVAVLGGLAILALVLALVFGVVIPMATRSGGGDWMNPARWSTFEAAKELKLRYARGEISREEYMRILRDLEPGSFAGEAPAAPPPAPEAPK